MSWVHFDEEGVSASGKTRIWIVASTLDKEDSREQYTWLGQVKWYAPWRRYCFFPAERTIFEQQCLRDIADFCAQQTIAHRNRQSNPGALHGND